jgi:hypothetical protein
VRIAETWHRELAGLKRLEAKDKRDTGPASTTNESSDSNKDSTADASQIAEHREEGMPFPYHGFALGNIPEMHTTQSMEERYLELTGIKFLLSVRMKVQNTN